jgi:hypothetical protein
MTTDHFCFYLQNRLIQTSQTGGQWYSDTSPFSIPWIHLIRILQFLLQFFKIYQSLHIFTLLMVSYRDNCNFLAITNLLALPLIM